MPDTSSSQAPSVVDLTTANRDIRGRALTLRETPKSEALQIKIWPSLYNPDQQAVRDEFYKLGDASSHIGMVSEAMGKTGIYTADYITGVKETLDGLEERIKEATEGAKKLMDQHDTQTQETTATTSKAPSVPE